MKYIFNNIKEMEVVYIKTIIIGGGASGLISAINLARKNKEVLILEKNNICGKKILVTGNGRCNYYNDNQDLRNYRSTNNELIGSIINSDTNKDVLDFFNSIGIVPKIKDGYYYPYSNQAVSIQNALIKEVKNLNIEVKNNTFVTAIKKENNKFIVTTNDGIFKSDKVIVASGSYASLKSMDECNSYTILESLSHKIIKPLPALVQLNTSGSFLKEWSGIRCDVLVKLLSDDIFVEEQTGEILLTNYGLSGICIMQLSSLISRGLDLGKCEDVVINFLPKFANSRCEFIKFMDMRNNSIHKRNITELLDSIINYKLVNILVKLSNINTTKNWNQLSDREKNILASNFVEFRLNITSTNSFKNAQTVSGGVPLTELNINTMESKIVDGLYLTGEILDVDGLCGGYNLTFAWTTGILAARGICND